MKEFNLHKKVKNGDKVTINYIGKIQGGTIFITSERKGPLAFVVGEYKKVKGLNQAVLEMSIGEEKVCSIPPEAAYGIYQKSLLRDLALNNLPEGISTGDVITDSAKKKWLVKDIDFEQQKASLDGNHILAGKTVIFEIKLIDIQVS